jgi:hypothetical protein
VALLRGAELLPTSADDFEYVVVKNPTLTGTPSWSAVPSDSTVEFDVSATGYTGGAIIQQGYFASTKQGSTVVADVFAYNWDFQLGVSLTPSSDIFSLGVRVLSGTGDAIGAISYWNLTV